MNSSNKIKFIYILSQRYSGSTLLSFLLAAYPELSTLGERRKFYNKLIRPDKYPNHTAKRCSCGELFTDCPYMNQIAKKLIEKTPSSTLNSDASQFYFSENRKVNRALQAYFKFCITNNVKFLLFPIERQLKRMLDFNLNLVKETLAIDGSVAFVDSSKTSYHLLYLSQIKELDLRVVWATRDPRAQINSALKYNDWTIEFAIQNWKEQMVENQNILEKLKLKYIELKYQDLCRQPEEELRGLFGFLGVNIDKINLDFRNATQHVIGNRNMRLGKDTKIKERKEWMTELSQYQIKLIEARTSDYAKFYSR